MATDNKKDKKKSNDWVAFFKGILSSFIMTIIWAIIGSNFLFIQKYIKSGETYLGTLFPDDPDKAPYYDKQYAKTGGSAHFSLMRNGQNGGGLNNDTIQLVNKITGLNKFSFPL